MSYLSAPKWDKTIDKRTVPDTDHYAKPLNKELVNGRCVITVTKATYRDGEFTGNFLLSKTEKLPLGNEGKQRVRIECCWYGHRLQKGHPKFLVDLTTAKVEQNFNGEVITNVGRVSH